MGTRGLHRLSGVRKPWVNPEKIRNMLRLEAQPRSVANELVRHHEEVRTPSTKGLLDGAEEALSAAKALKSVGKGTWAFVPAYCSMFQVARALISNVGMFVPRDTDHFVLMKIAQNYKEVANGAPEMKEEVMWLAQPSMREQRNDIVHSGLNHIKRETINEAIERAESFLAKAKALIKPA